ncbi:endonuclease/exonuclease/phosphatase family protein [Prosthecomicrobium pneumaticum]|uniref:Endonuclease/exonuclease/phosphatase family metal-dependent hydrolase n=1 Tax=Prosthecomicrobium pneumaticum TaxID=81895 RepID=A0A7W9CVI5_9HYPH|nr:endonuclease/exonuclease/phosphatase family protein [Prosthecomicrobium pneumaticum]MBB5752358.1 endonuclease/exonuclease/phosphatase family metal-dependent hydrolase [Prosthecomicrobium pneumaticum]
MSPSATRPQIPGAVPLRILTYNVHRCLGLDRRYSPQRIASVIAESGADVIALQEIDAHRPRSGHVDQAMEIAEALKMQVHFFPALRLEEELYGDAVLSTYPMRLVKAASLPRPPGRLWEERGALWVEIDLGAARLQVVNTHFGLRDRERRMQAEVIMGPEWFARPDMRPPAVLLGDFNSVPDSAAYRRLTTDLRDAQRLIERPPRATFPTRFPLLRLDHVFLYGDIAVRDVTLLRSRTARIASDHVPLSVDLTIPAETKVAVPEGMDIGA